MAVDINIPGIGVISANNAAQDSTLNAILSAIQAQTGTTTNVSSAGLSAANQRGSKLAGTLGIQRLQQKSFLALACLQVNLLQQVV